MATLPPGVPPPVITTDEGGKKVMFVIVSWCNGPRRHLYVAKGDDLVAR